MQKRYKSQSIRTVLTCIALVSYVITKISVSRALLEISGKLVFKPFYFWYTGPVVRRLDSAVHRGGPVIYSKHD
jgi:hypothetical protein